MNEKRESIIRTLKRSSTKIDEIVGQFGKQWAETNYEVLLRKDSQVSGG
jgi:hypothetical protein